MGKRIVFSLSGDRPTAEIEGASTTLNFLAGKLGGSTKTAYLNIGDQKRVAVAALDREAGTATLTPLKGNELEFNGQVHAFIVLTFENSGGWKFVRIGPPPVTAAEPVPEPVLVPPPGGVSEPFVTDASGGGAEVHTVLPFRPTRNFGPILDLGRRPVGGNGASPRVVRTLDTHGRSATGPSPGTFTPAPRKHAGPGNEGLKSVPAKPPEAKSRSKGRGNDILVSPDGRNVPIVSTMISAKPVQRGFPAFLKLVTGSEPVEYSLNSVPLLLITRGSDDTGTFWIVRPLEGNTLRLNSGVVRVLRIRLNQSDRVRELVPVEE